MQSLVHKNHQIGMNIMLKNFSPSALGINGRQSELIELALTYGFASMDIDMHEMLRRAQRTTTQDAAKYLEAAKIDIGGFDLGVDLDADEDAFTSQVGGLHPIAELAKELGATRGYIRVPAATDRLPYHEYYEIQRGRLGQINEVLEPRGIQLCIGFSAGKELEEGKEFPFVRNVEGFVAMVKSVASPNAGFMIDTWDWVVGDGTMDQLSELTAAEIVAVRLGSVTKEVEPGNVTSCDRVLPEQDGLLNHVDLIKHLASIQFTGPISPSASSTSYKGQTRESIVKRAHEAVDAISVEAGLEVATLPKDLIEDIPYEPNPIN
jgi:sugar phosphate isomerase/epimerase